MSQIFLQLLGPLFHEASTVWKRPPSLQHLMPKQFSMLKLKMKCLINIWSFEPISYFLQALSWATPWLTQMPLLFGRLSLEISPTMPSVSLTSSSPVARPSGCDRVALFFSYHMAMKEWSVAWVPALYLLFHTVTSLQSLSSFSTDMQRHNYSKFLVSSFP